ncbi:hypothetical protein Bequi_09920 [Brachybacterium sp. JHP9]|uniref:Uncharacterized protein n=1 Tax=Brachybacterium equifaecis TaxID=2910770 RepID=A0ABT0R450_9MICO|nr:hypothetical protein [Brachybacterium equifaecis]MCL6423700.1 hypothetical protein [Brachybacterium equifaecis]
MTARAERRQRVVGAVLERGPLRPGEVARDFSEREEMPRILVLVALFDALELGELELGCGGRLEGPQPTADPAPIDENPGS